MTHVHKILPLILNSARFAMLLTMWVLSTSKLHTKNVVLEAEETRGLHKINAKWLSSSITIDNAEKNKTIRK